MGSVADRLDQEQGGYFPSNRFTSLIPEPPIADGSGRRRRGRVRLERVLGYLMAWYFVCVFHMASTIAASCLASVSLARFGLVPA